MDSPGLFLTPLSSVASVELYEDVLKPRIDTITNSNATLQEMVDTSEKTVNEVFMPSPRCTLTNEIGDQDVSVQLDKVLFAMLIARACSRLQKNSEHGGQSGKRYVVAAICSCPEHDDMVGALAALSVTWLTHFLLVC